MSLLTQDVRDYLTDLGRGWVAEIHGKVVGFCYAASGDASIWALFVSPEYEGLGLGKRLLDCAVDWLFGLGNQSVHLRTAANTRADSFYSARGWIRGDLGWPTSAETCTATTCTQSFANGTLSYTK